MHTKKYEMHTIYPAYPWYAMMSYQIWYVMYTIDLDAILNLVNSFKALKHRGAEHRVG